MKNREWVKLMTPKEQKRFERNFVKCESNEERILNEYYSETSNTFEVFVDGAFYYDLTKEGVPYWSKISKKYK